MRVKLIWEWVGYRPEHSNWDSFAPSIHEGIICHDLYHHQPHETGTDLEEMAALGGRLRFSDMNFVDRGYIGFTTGDTIFTEDWRDPVRVFRKGRRSIKPLARAVANNKWVKNSLIAEINYALLVKRMTESYDKALRFPVKAYERVRSHDFRTPHNENKTLEVELMTGEVFEVE